MSNEIFLEESSIKPEMVCSIIALFVICAGNDDERLYINL